MPVYHTVAYEFGDTDTMADAFCGRSDAHDYSRVTNPTVTPHVAYMQTLGLETLAVRYSRQSSSALQLAERLKMHPSIIKVNCIGLKDNQFHKTASKQYGPTCSAMITIELESPQASTIYGNFTPEERCKMDIPENLIRLSIGLENVEDLYDDIAQAFDPVR